MAGGTSTRMASHHTSYIDDVTTTFIEYIAPTCTEKGKRTYRCAICNEVTSEEFPLTDHTYDYDNPKVLKEATCTEDGLIEYTCKVCGQTETVIDYAGHDPLEGTYVSKTSSCTEGGYQQYTCSRCGEFIKDSWPAQGHVWEKQTDGSYKCPKCGVTLDVK